jgi:PAS domain S-box-containing protein
MKKLFIIIFIFLVCVVAGASYYYMQSSAKIIQSIYLKESKNLKKMFEEEVVKKQGRTAAMTYILSQDKSVVEALVQKDNTIVDFSETIKGIEHFGEYKNLWIQIIDNNGDSFYRSWTNNVGDSVSKIRVDVAQMLENPKPMQNVSTGRFDMTFKTILPLFNKGEFVGMIELISHFNSIAIEMKQKGIEPVFVVDKSYTPKFFKPFTGLFIKNNYVANFNASKQLMSQMGREGIDEFLNIKEYKMFEKYLVTTYQIENIKDKPMGYFVLFKQLDMIDMKELQEFKLLSLKRFIVFMSIFGLIVLLLISRKYVKTLNKEVIEKTKKIRKQKEDLDHILTTYDKHVIFSKTNKKGIITYASEAFCKVSGYTKKELIGQNHNIIRHPDMPREAFAGLWEELEKEKSVRLEVKNQKKDGGYYWVEAEIEPEYNKDGKLIGYLAIRDDITANKDIEQIQKDIIFTMGSIGESRSRETGNHVKRVAEYTKLLAALYGLPYEEVEMLGQASPMHDIGKVAIPDSILKKEGKLTKKEWSIMQSHSLKGYDMLKQSNRTLLKTAAIVALEHHEKYDGTGYPTGLKGEEIHIYGRITAIADVFDALGSDRCYKKAWKDKKIFKYFKAQQGKHFDPELVEIFFNHIDKFLEIRERYKDSISSETSK